MLAGGGGGGGGGGGPQLILGRLGGGWGSLWEVGGGSVLTCGGGGFHPLTDSFTFANSLSLSWISLSRGF